ncbi:hypothetical protein GN244_ATG18494 [Phytophthora infestans]|uniref:BAT2 N-terminal domain-containing protein n=1 Tax=Phytophthora infestans TaxID=4787 RepID=A0A833S6W4_PHYIN|nr:hypothetical protein GN244_ATG18494 [Phytophthora infestans]KAF4148682.1 hypothetical protein GN958_ATG02162 [Phytophthora infestans]
MNATTNAKPKATFSSRNLSAVFKASLRTKPLPDNATGSLQRPNSRMRVLGRAAVAPPAPINTPSLKRQGQVHDVRVSLVPASSNWAESGIEKEQKSETRELEPSLADVVAPPEAPEKVWTSESVAEHLHTGDVSARPKITLESSGRWGDDAVEQDIVQNNICRQMLKERKFPDLKEAAEEVQMHHNRARTPTTDRPTSSMGLQQVEQHRGRATGRWAQMERPMQDNCWTRDHYGRDEDDVWSQDRQGDNRWSNNRHEDGRFSRGYYPRHDDDYGREHRPNESSNDTDSPVPKDSNTHFNRSDARFAFGDRDRVLSYNPHSLGWGSNRFARRDGRSSFSTSLFGLEDSLSRSPQPDHSLSRPSALMTSDVPSEDGRNKVFSEENFVHAWGRAAPAWSKVEEASTPVAEKVVESSCTESSSSLQLQLLQRPKMLFDPKTGGMVNAEDKVAPGKRQESDRSCKDSANSAAVLMLTSATKRSDRSLEIDSNAAITKTTENIKAMKPSATALIGDTSTVNLMRGVLVNDTARANKFSSKECNRKHPPKWATSREEATQIESEYRRCCWEEMRRGSRNPAPNARHSAMPNNGKKSERGEQRISTRSHRAGSNKATRRRSSRRVKGANGQQSKVTPQTSEVLKQIADGASGGVVVLTDEQKGVEVSPEDEGFGTVKSRRAVLSAKKPLRLRLASTEDAAPVLAIDEELQSNGEQVQENVSIKYKVIDSQVVPEPRGKTANSRRNAEPGPKDRKPKMKQLKQANTKQVPGKAAAFAEANQPISPVKPTEQVAGEAPAESTVPKKRTQYGKVVRELKPRRQKQNLRKTSLSSAGGGHRKQEPPQRNVQKLSTPGQVVKVKPQQVRQVYVAKTPAPVSSAMSTAA